MSESKHTPGPWRYIEYGVVRGGPLSEYTNGVSDEQIALAMIPNRDTGAEIRDANARLIAAAPDLLEACKSLLASGRTAYEVGDEWPDACKLAIAAISKAEGR